MTLNPQAQKELRENPIFFAQQALDFKPFDYQEKLLTDKSQRIVACMGRQTGKTTTIAAKAIHYAYTHNKTTTLIISPSLRQSMIMFDKIVTLLNNSKLLNESVKRKTRTIIQLSTQSKIIALPCSEHLLRGYTANLAICDEAAFIPETIITEIIYPMISTTKGTTILLSTPWDKNHFFYKAFLNPAYSTHKIPSTENPLIPQEFLKEMQQNMTTEAYKREYQAEFTEAATSYFQQELIRKCIEHAQQLSLEPYQTLEQEIPKAQYYAGLDLGKLQDHSALAIIQKDQDTLKLVYHHQFPLQMSYTEVINTLTRADEKFRFQKLLADQSGIGEPVLENMQEQGITCAQGAKLVAETLAQAGTPCIETVAVMAKYNPFFEKAGMKRVAESKPSTHVSHALQQLEQLGFDTALLAGTSYTEQKIQPIGTKPIQTILQELSQHDGSVRRRLANLKNIYPKHQEFTEKIAEFNPAELAVALKRLSFCAQSKVYLFWDSKNSVLK